MKLFLNIILTRRIHPAGRRPKVTPELAEAAMGDLVQRMRQLAERGHAPSVG